MAAQFANLDPGFITETLTRQITASITEAPQIFKDMSYFMSFKDGDFSNINYYLAGTSAGRLIKVFFDFTLKE
jgi:N12 class adenine-specific DNA methylase